MNWEDDHGCREVEDLEGGGHDLLQGTIPALTGEGEENHSVRTLSNMTKILECYCCSALLRICIGSVEFLSDML
jgi:hypothetical protein